MIDERLVINGDEHDLDKMIYLSKINGNIEQGLAEIEKIAKAREEGEAVACVMEGSSPDGEEMYFISLPDYPDAEGVAIAKADVESGALTIEDGIRQCCKQLVEG